MYILICIDLTLYLLVAIVLYFDLITVLIVTVRVMDHFRALGCVVTKTAVKRKLEDADDVDSGAASASSSSLALQPTASCTAVLKIPLNFPNPRKGKRRN